MKIRDKNKGRVCRGSVNKSLESIAEIFADILISQIEISKDCDEDVYEKERKLPNK